MFVFDKHVFRLDFFSVFYEKVRLLPVVNSKNKLVGVLREEDLLDFYKPRESMGRGGGAGESDSGNRHPGGACAGAAGAAEWAAG